MSHKDLDFTIFGATGFTGKLITQHLLTRLRQLGRLGTSKVALVARNSGQLTEVVERLKVEHSEAKIVSFSFDAQNSQQLVAVCKRTKVMLNCAGPYRRCGEAVVTACLEGETHYVDIAGEPTFIFDMAIKYHQVAVEKRLTMVPACGFDCVPHDLAFQFLLDSFPGEEIMTAESVVQFSGLQVRFQSFRSVVEALAEISSFPRYLSDLQKMNHVEAQFSQPESAKKQLFVHPVMNKWCVPFEGADASIVQRSLQLKMEQSVSNHKDSSRILPRVSLLVGLPNLFYAVLMIFFQLLVILLSQFSFGRRLLFLFPYLFTCGFNAENPRIGSSTWSIDLFGKVKGKPDVHAVVSGIDAPYVTTPIVIVECALCLWESNGSGNLPFGVLPPAFTFSSMNLVSRLQEQGISFKIKDQ